MKKVIITILFLMLAITILSAIVIVIFFTLTDTKTIVPEEVKEICNVKEDKYLGRNVFTISPKIATLESKNDTQNMPIILYFHGGAYMAEASKNHWNFVSRLVNDTGLTLVLVDYPLTPKYNYKDVFEMVEPLYKEVISYVGQENLILLGILLVEE